MPSPAGTFALLTPPGEGGIAVIGVEGRGARKALLAALDCPRLTRLRAGRLALGRLLDGDGTVLDEVIVACLAPRGAIERFELNCHGGAAAAAAAAGRLAEAGLAAGATEAGRGLPLVEREFLAALAILRTTRQLTALAAAQEQLPAELRAQAGLLRAGRCGEALERLAALEAESARLARLLAVHRLVLAGPANAGKSTLFNRLAGADRAIVSPQPGTTRDCVEACVSLQGLAVDLVDTAGLGLPESGLDAEAMSLTRRSIRRGDMLLAVLDASAPAAPEVYAELGKLAAGAGGCLLVLTKTDLPVAGGVPRRLPGLPASVRVSARTGEGLDGLIAAIAEQLLPDPPRGTAAAGRGARERIGQAGTCVRERFEDNPGPAAAEAAGILESLLEAPEPELDEETS
jgi:tRNA modification GTPase